MYFPSIGCLLIGILGGGIIGCTTAYFLTRHPSYNPSTHQITILEATSIASGASGKAGGLLALWAYPSSIVPLSYRLHAELAKEHDGAKRWGYRGLNCASIEAKGQAYEKPMGMDINSKGGEWHKLPKTNGKTSVPSGVPNDLDWVDPSTIRGYSTMGTPETTAQVHPYLFTTSMASLATEAGAHIVIGSVTSLDHSTSSGVKSVTYKLKSTNETHTIPATDIILSAGPWTSKIFPAAPISAMRAHSVVIKAEVAPYAIFSEISLPGGKNGRRGATVSPEMYARPDGTVYACGLLLKFLSFLDRC